jgi:AraC-like DNA-binding protein
MMRQSDRLTFRTFSSESDHSTRLHSHPYGQFTYVRHGLIGLKTETEVWINETKRLFWIPPGFVHASRSQGPVDGWLVLIAPEYAKALPQQICVLHASSLLVASLERFGTITERQDRIADVLLELIQFELLQTKTDTLKLRLPSSVRLLAWAMAFLEAPSIKASIDDAASNVGMSRRAFTRHFQNQTGCTFSQWKRLAVVQRATERLAEGNSVTTIAFELGYENPSAFIAMFRTLRGATPRQFLTGANNLSSSYAGDYVTRAI